MKAEGVSERMTEVEKQDELIAEVASAGSIDGVEVGTASLLSEMLLEVEIEEEIDNCTDAGKVEEGKVNMSSQREGSVGEKSPRLSRNNTFLIPHNYDMLTKAMVKAHRAIRQSGQPNFKQCKIPVYSKLKLDYWESQLEQYKDVEVVSLLKYGCPISYTGELFSRQKCRNHKGASEFGSVFVCLFESY